MLSCFWCLPLVESYLHSHGVKICFCCSGVWLLSSLWWWYLSLSTWKRRRKSSISSISWLILWFISWFHIPIILIRAQTYPYIFTRYVQFSVITAGPIKSSRLWMQKGISQKGTVLFSVCFAYHSRLNETFFMELKVILFVLESKVYLTIRLKNWVIGLQYTVQNMSKS